MIQVGSAIISIGHELLVFNARARRRTRQKKILENFSRVQELLLTLETSTKNYCDDYALIGFVASFPFRNIANLLNVLKDKNGSMLDNRKRHGVKYDVDILQRKTYVWQDTDEHA